MLYIANHLDYKPRNDLKIYKASELESTFIKLLSSKKAEVLIGCIHRRPTMNQEESNKYYLNNLLKKIAMEKKTGFLNDFNNNLLEYEKHNSTNDFFQFFVNKYDFTIYFAPF